MDNQHQVESKDAIDNASIAADELEMSVKVRLLGILSICSIQTAQMINGRKVWKIAIKHATEVRQML